MQTFLEKVVAHVLNNDKVSVEQTCFVFPNRRTGLYLKKYLAENIKRAIFSPAFYTIDDFAAEISGLHTEEQFVMLLQLYLSYKECVKDKNIPVYNFENFISWGSMLLSDFNDIDSYRAEPGKVFEYLTEAKAIALWNPDKPELTSLQKEYLNFYQSLGLFYSHFTEKLLADKCAYQGLMYKQIIEKSLYKSFLSKWAHVYFVGFNALSTAEEQIIDFFIKNNKASIYFDYDHFYLNNSGHEAGFHIRKAVKKWGNSPFDKDLNHLMNQKKDIHIIGVPKNIGQAKLTGLLLSKLNYTIEPNNTAVVLCQEDIVFALLNSIPAHIENINVTMGYPLEKSSVFEFFDAVISLFENTNRFQKLRKDNAVGFNVKDILKISENPFLKLIDKHNDASQFNKILNEAGKIFYKHDELTKVFHALNISENLYFSVLMEVFSFNMYSCKKITALLRNIVDLLIKSSVFQSSSPLELSIEVEFIYCYTKMLKKLQDFLDIIDETEIDSFKNLHKLLIKNLKVPFTGEPLSGLQIMGFLETRNLDFENVFMLSVNEGVMPLSKFHNSFIPVDIRRHFSLPVYYDNDSIYAYHLYRLIQRASNVYLFYNTENDNMGGGEKSRFISQILFELSACENLNINQGVLTVPISDSNNDYKITILKTEQIMGKLKERVLKGISPSSLNIFIQCPFRFYLQYIVGVKELEEPEEQLDAAEFGTIIHGVLEDLYQPKAQSFIEKDFYNITDSELEVMLEKAFRSISKYTDTKYGKNHLLFKIAHKYLKNFLKEEKKYVDELAKNGLKLFLESTEMTLKKTLNINTQKGTITVNLNGKIDRTDKVGNTLRIIDYKSGSVKDEDIKLDSWDKLNKEKLSGKLVQLLLYTYLYAHQYQINDFRCGFYSLKKNTDGFMFIQFPEGQTSYNKSINDAIETFISDIFSNMFDEDVPIEQTSIKDNCQFCDFKIICNRLKL